MCLSIYFVTLNLFKIHNINFIILKCIQFVLKKNNIYISNIIIINNLVSQLWKSNYYTIIYNIIDNLYYTLMTPVHNWKEEFLYLNYSLINKSH